MERNEQRRIVEALILASSEPISAARLAEIVPGCKPGAAKDLVNELNTEYEEQDRSFEIWEVAGGYQVRTRAEFSGYLQKLQKTRPLRLSRAALETLAIIAYKQPATRAEIESVRGVDAGAVVKSLLERDLVKIAGQREVPGRPMLYATTKRFLEIFGLGSIKELPTLRDIDELSREPALEADEAPDADEAGGEEDEREGTVAVQVEGADATEEAIADADEPADEPRS
jgi:segregation and condensation protein B